MKKHTKCEEGYGLVQTHSIEILNYISKTEDIHRKKKAKYCELQSQLNWKEVHKAKVMEEAKKLTANEPLQPEEDLAKIQARIMELHKKTKGPTIYDKLNEMRKLLDILKGGMTRQTFIGS